MCRLRRNSLQQLPSSVEIGYNEGVRMSMTIEIASDLEPLLKAEAGKAGVDPIAYTQHLLRKSLPSSPPSAPAVTAEESRLLKEINQGVSSEGMVRYEELIQKRQQETISSEEFRELEDFTRRLEDFQARRMHSLAALAKLRDIALSDLIDQLEIRPPDVL